MLNPSPVPPVARRVLKKGSNTWSSCSEVMPQPRSRTFASNLSSWVAALMATDFPGCDASMALEIRFTKICSISTGFIKTFGRFSGNFSRIATPCCSALFRSMSAARRIA